MNHACILLQDVQWGDNIMKKLCVLIHRKGIISVTYDNHWQPLSFQLTAEVWHGKMQSQH